MYRFLIQIKKCTINYQIEIIILLIHVEVS